MTRWFDEARLDDPGVLSRSDTRLRFLAESGARVRREYVDAGEELAAQDEITPRAIVAAGPDSRLLRAVLEPVCPVPFVAWPGPRLPGWAGSLDLVVILSPRGDDEETARAVAEAVRRGCQVVAACPPDSLVAEHATGRDCLVLPTGTRDQLATAAVMLTYLCGRGLAPEPDADAVAEALDSVAGSCSPHSDLSVNPGKLLAIALADSAPVFWGGSALAARAARRVAEAVRRSTGAAALAGEMDQVLPVIESAREHSVFDDPFAEGADESAPRPVLVVMDDGSGDARIAEQRASLAEAATQRGVRVEVLEQHEESSVARYAALVLAGTYAAEYLRIGSTDG